MKARWFCVLTILFFLAPTEVRAGGAILVDTDISGEPALWKDGIISYNLESGENGLGKLTTAEAAELVRDLFDLWKRTSIEGIQTTNIQPIEGVGLGSVDLSNMNRHLTYCPPEQACAGESPPFIKWLYWGVAKSSASFPEK